MFFIDRFWLAWHFASVTSNQATGTECANSSTDLDWSKQTMGVKTLAVRFQMNSGVFLLWWECDSTSIRPNWWKNWRHFTSRSFIGVWKCGILDWLKSRFRYTCSNTFGQWVVSMFTRDLCCCILFSFTDSFNSLPWKGTETSEKWNNV